MNHLINRELSETFDQISRRVDGFYFGRFDLRCASLEDLYQGRVKILELNGCGAEPAHIYQPGFSFFEAVSVLLRHWQNIYVIAQQNKLKGHRFLSFQEARAYYRKFKEGTTA